MELSDLEGLVEVGLRETLMEGLQLGFGRVYAVLQIGVMKLKFILRDSDFAMDVVKLAIERVAFVGILTVAGSTETSSG